MAKKATYKANIKDVNVTGREGVEPSAISVVKVLELAKMLSKGKSRQTIIEYAMSHYNVSEVQAKRYYVAASKYLIPDNLDEYRKGIIQQNMERLETIIEKCMEDRQWKTAREAIDSLNKMFGINGSGIQVGIHTDNENNTQQVVIKFNE